MTQFLEDYGLRWVGDSRSDQDDSDFDGERLLADVDGERQNRPAYAPEAWSVNMNKIQASVAELNTVAEQDAKIVRQGGVSKFKQQDPVPICFWQNGLQVGDCPFWSYSHANAARVLADISEAYFPYCLKEQFPEGVLLRVVDKVKEPYDEQKAKEVLFPQGGHILGSQPKPTALVGRLPDKVIKSGQVVHVAGPVAAMVGPVDGVETLDLLAQGRLESAPVVTLSVRMERGEKIVLRTEVETTVGAVLAVLNRVRRERKMPSISPGVRALCTNMPPRTYESEEETVTQAGLAPNAALFVRVLGTPAE